MKTNLLLRIILGTAFAGFGVHCLLSSTMAAEFERYGLPQLRMLTAFLQLAGAVGLLCGPSPKWVAASATGLGGLMIAALVVRLRVNDPWYLMLSAFLMLVGNGWLAIRMWRIETK